MRVFNPGALIETLTGGKTEELLRSAHVAKVTDILFAHLAEAEMEAPLC